MPFSRRDFIKTVGITLGALIASGAACTPGLHRPDDEPGAPRHPAWDRLRQCWLDLGKPVSFDAWDQLDERPKVHRAILDELVAAGELEAPVADQMQIAFQEAAYHIQRSLATCYIALPFEYKVREDLLQQATLLEQVAGDLDPAVAAKAQAALARDMAFFDALTAGEPASELYKRYDAGEIVASPEAIEAARILVDLLLVRPA
jgi:hypothetical protein